MNYLHFNLKKTIKAQNFTQVIYFIAMWSQDIMAIHVFWIYRKREEEGICLKYGLRMKISELLVLVFSSSLLFLRCLVRKKIHQRGKQTCSLLAFAVSFSWSCLLTFLMLPVSRNLWRYILKFLWINEFRNENSN